MSYNGGSPVSRSSLPSINWLELEGVLISSIELAQTKTMVQVAHPIQYAKADCVRPKDIGLSNSDIEYNDNTRTHPTIIRCVCAWTGSKHSAQLQTSEGLLITFVTLMPRNNEKPLLQIWVDELTSIRLCANTSSPGIER